MLRKIIKIDEDKCNGCGLCASACHEGAIGIVDGKAKLLRDDYCDGLGDCLGECPMGAISFELREAEAYDEAAVFASMKERGIEHPAAPVAAASELSNFPVQIKLLPIKSAAFNGVNLLVAADCCAFAYGDFHRRFIRGHATVIGCPKLDMVDYSEKLGEILKKNDIRSITVARMQVPCCGGLTMAVKKAIEKSGKDIPCLVHIITPDGKILED